MENSINNRKEFIKKLALGISSIVMPTGLSGNNSIDKPTKLSEEQITFLYDYETWLKDFKRYIEKRNMEPFNLENNKKLMQLSEIAEKRKTVLEDHMKDPVFAAYFNHISREITNII